MLWVLYASFKNIYLPFSFHVNSTRVSICWTFNYLFIWEDTFLYFSITAASIFPNLIFYSWDWWALGTLCKFLKYLSTMQFLKNSKRVTICQKFNQLFIWEDTILYFSITAASTFTNLIFYSWDLWAYALGILCKFKKCSPSGFQENWEIFFLWQNYLTIYFFLGRD
jgi:hypothetical protein